MPIVKRNKKRKQEWCANDYQRAAHKHFVACEKLIKNYENNFKKDHGRAVCHEIYYLSGYIVECILKYGIIMAEVGYPTKCLSKQELDGINLKIHKLSELKQRYIDNNYLGANNIKWSSHLDSWSEAIRYDRMPSKDDAIITDLSDYFNNTVKLIYTTIKTQY